MKHSVWFGIVACSAWLLPLSVDAARDAAGGRGLRIREEVGQEPGVSWVGGAESSTRVLKIENGGDQPLRVTVLTLDGPGIEAPVYTVEGMVRTEDVQGSGYLEMWSHFPGGAAYFSRTLGEPGGPMSRLEGTSAWRHFALPFQCEPTGPRPTRLVLNVVLPGKGRVYLEPALTLWEHPSGQTSMHDGDWLTSTQAGLAGGLVGSLAGTLGAAIGVLASLGRGRAFVVATLRGMTAFGTTAFVVGIVALALGQSYHVYYVFLLTGALLGIVPTLSLTGILRRYESAELRRMEALDVS
jgi:hypothetical protein